MMTNFIALFILLGFAFGLIRFGIMEIIKESGDGHPTESPPVSPGFGYFPLMLGIALLLILLASVWVFFLRVNQ